MKEEKIYYEKILVSSGEVPEVTGYYDTDRERLYYSSDFKCWFEGEHDADLRAYPSWYFKPAPQEALLFAEWVDKNYMNTPTGWIPRGDQYDKDYKCYTLSELYDKFKEKGEK